MFVSMCIYVKGPTLPSAMRATQYYETRHHITLKAELISATLPAYISACPSDSLPGCPTTCLSNVSMPACRLGCLPPRCLTLGSWPEIEPYLTCWPISSMNSLFIRLTSLACWAQYKSRCYHFSYLDRCKVIEDDICLIAAKNQWWRTLLPWTATSALCCNNKQFQLSHRESDKRCMRLPSAVIFYSRETAKLHCIG